MSSIVMKFGGTSVADIERIRAAAHKVEAEVKRGHEVAVVVSAMSGVTNRLVDYCTQINPLHDAREYDVVVSSGEIVTAGLMALELQKRGLSARSWQGWQLPIVCNKAHGKARILRIEGEKMIPKLEAGEVSVLAGFQGVTSDGRVATLGRGGSDTTAVALAAALKADRCDIYTDVNGVYTTDPRITSKARKLKTVAYEEMLEMASTGAKVLQVRSVEMGMKWGVPVQVLSTFEEPIGSDMPGTLITKEEDVVERELVTGITCNRDEAKITLLDVPDEPGYAARMFGPLAKANINVDLIVQNVSREREITDMTFTVPKSDLARTLEILKENESGVVQEIISDDSLVKISVVGVGMRSHAGVALTMFESLAKKGINIDVISTSEIKISVLIAEEYAELAVRILHEAYGLDKEEG